MILTFDQIREITHGAARVEQQNGAVRFFRFTEAQQEAYLQASPNDFYKKTFATAGVRLCFTTDSAFVRLRYRMTKASSRCFGWFDVYEKGVLVAHFGGDTSQVLEGCAEVPLCHGEKKVEIYFPWSAAGEILSLELEDGAAVCPVKKKLSMLAFGDSITQGYDAVYPSRSYQNRISDLLDASCINKGIGGERFFPELLGISENVKPDLITVAYGTNDWSKRDPVTYEENCRGFFSALTSRYPDAKIIVITPIWRADNTKQTPFGAPLWEAVRLIKAVCAEFPGICVIHAGSFTPRLAEFYSDGYLHPNDFGFAFYAENLYPAIVKAMEDGSR